MHLRRDPVGIGGGSALGIDDRGIAARDRAGTCHTIPTGRSAAPAAVAIQRTLARLTPVP
ncbi:hypothetical protein [Cryobacterium sp. SO1]|uniref:hypothetical protein n=1 Tax=Cryobacterium sp. SO1 TaxID=1897061 RepID=UPI0010233980|nr:hypothetical protein [Cryobacterium sp. SO1]